MTQINLLLSSVSDTASAHRDQVLAILEDGQWHTRKEIERLTGLNERTVRMIAEQSNGKILGTDKGYKLQKYADSVEYFEWENRIRSQAKTMLRRIIQARRERNRNQRGEAA